MKHAIFPIVAILALIELLLKGTLAILSFGLLLIFTDASVEYWDSKILEHYHAL